MAAWALDCGLGAHERFELCSTVAAGVFKNWHKSLSLRLIINGFNGLCVKEVRAAGRAATLVVVLPIRGCQWLDTPLLRVAGHPPFELSECR